MKKRLLDSSKRCLIFKSAGMSFLVRRMTEFALKREAKQYLIILGINSYR